MQTSFLNLFSRLFILAIILVSCSTTKKMKSTSSFEKVVFSKSGCFGTCPIYDMVIYPNGNAEYTGKRYADFIGKHLATLTDDRIKEVKVFTEKVLASKHLNKSLDSEIADLPSTYITIYTKNDSIKFESKLKFEDPLEDLNQCLTKCATTINWERDKNAPAPPPHLLRVQFKRQTNVDEVIGDFFKQKLRMKNYISKKDEIALMSFDPFTMTAEEMVRELTRREDVIKVEIEGRE